MSSRDLQDSPVSAYRSRAIGLLAPVLLVCFLLLASFFWRAQDKADSLKGKRDPCRPLVRAVEQGDVGAVETFLSEGCSANHLRPGVLSAPSDETARVRLKSRSDKSRFAGTPLLEIAAQNNDIKIIKLLLLRGAKVDGRGVYGYTALIRAASRANVEAVSLLLEAGADPNLRDTLFRETALHKATRSASRRFVETPEIEGKRTKIVRLLLRSGADRSIADSRGRKALDGYPLQ
ncbi:MAG: ankyrin repeat domain-containing protein [Armatimonadota bacterium]